MKKTIDKNKQLFYDNYINLNGVDVGEKRNSKNKYKCK